MWVCAGPQCTRSPVHERLQLLLSSLRDLDQRRLCQQVLVRSVLDPDPVLVQSSDPQGVLLKTSLDPSEPDLIQIQDLDHKKPRNWEQNVLQLKQQLSSLRSRDLGLVSELQELDRQILQLRLDAPLSCDPPPAPQSCDPPESPAPDSRPSSGFFDLSDGASLSTSAFSLCSALDPEATPTSPVTPPTAAEAPPPASDLSLPGPSPSGPSSAPPLSPPPPSHLDRYISSLLQRCSLAPSRPKSHRPLLIQTSLSHRPHPSAGPLTKLTDTGPLISPKLTEGWPTAEEEEEEEVAILGQNSRDNKVNRSKLNIMSANSTESGPKLTTGPLTSPSVTAGPLTSPSIITGWTTAEVEEVKEEAVLVSNSRGNKLNRSKMRKTSANSVEEEEEEEAAILGQSFEDNKLNLCEQSKKSPNSTAFRFKVTTGWTITEEEEEKEEAILGQNSRGNKLNRSKMRKTSSNSVEFNAKLTAGWTTAEEEEEEEEEVLGQTRDSSLKWIKLSQTEVRPALRGEGVGREFLFLSEEEELTSEAKRAQKQRKVRSEAEERRKTGRKTRRDSQKDRGMSRGCAEAEEERKRRRRRRKHRRHRTEVRADHRPHRSTEGTTERTTERTTEETTEEQGGPSALRKRSGAEDARDRASPWSNCVTSRRFVVKPRSRRGQSQSSRATMSQERSCRRPIREGGGAEEETGSERAGRGGTQRQPLARIKVSHNLKKRILRQNTGVFTLMTTV